MAIKPIKSMIRSSKRFQISWPLVPRMSSAGNPQVIQSACAAAAILLPGDRSQAATCASVLAPDPHGNCLGSGGFLLKWGLPGQTSPPWRIAGTFHQVPTLRLMPVTGGRCAGYGHIMFHSQRIAPIRRQAKKWLFRQHSWPPEDDQESLYIWFVRPEGGNGDGHHPGGGMLACISKLFDAPKLLDGTLGTIIAI